MRLASDAGVERIEATPVVSIDARHVVVVGAGGHGRELADIVRAAAEVDGSISLLGIVDDGDPDRALLARSELRFLGPPSAIESRTVDVLIGIGDPGTRERLDRRVGDRSAPALVHPSATVGSASRLAPGVVLAQQAVVTTNVAIGRHAHVNVAATIAHDCRIADYVTIGPGANLAGSVTVGRRTFVGIGATILPGVSIGDDVMIAAGAVVCADVPDGQTVRGVPARQ